MVIIIMTKCKDKVMETVEINKVDVIKEEVEEENVEHVVMEGKLLIKVKHTVEIIQNKRIIH